MKVLLLGDCHGQLEVVHRACCDAKDIHGVEAAIQVGDFGFNKGFHCRKDKGAFPLPVHAIDGCFDDHEWLHKCRSFGMLEIWKKYNLVMHERGTVIEIGGLRFGFLGGALYTDRCQKWADQLAPGKPNSGRIPEDPAWANWVTEGDLARALAAFAATPPDVLVTHSCPADIGIGMEWEMSELDDVTRFITRAGHQGGPLHDCGEGRLTGLWRGMHQKPRLWMYGHFHRIHAKRIDGTIFLCCGVAFQEPVDPYIILDTDTWQVESFPTRPPERFFPSPTGFSPTVRIW